MRFLMLVLLVACMNPAPPVYHPAVISLVDTDSDKAIQVVSDERMNEHEPREVATSAVASALIASGMFLDDDARILAEPIARELPNMRPRESLRIVGWAADAPRYYYVLIHGGRLQIIYYAGSTQSDSYSAVLPTDAVAIVDHHEAPPIPAPSGDAAVATSPAPDTHVAAPASDAGTAVATTATPPAGSGGASPPDAGTRVAAATPPAPHPRPARPARPIEPITEAEARRKMRELDDALAAGLISQSELKSRRKEILARL